MSALLDTGAVVSFVGQDLLAQLIKQQAPMKTKEFKREVVAVNGTPVKITAEVELQLKTELGQMTHWFLAAEMGPELVLGHDFLAQHKWEWCWTDRTVRRTADPGAKLPIQCQGTGDTATLYAAHNIHVPPLGHIKASGILMERPKFQQAEVAINASGPTNGLYDLQDKVDTDTGQIPLCLQNNLDNLVTITKGEIIGHLRSTKVEEPKDKCRLTEMPPELEELLSRSTVGLTTEQAKQVRDLLNEFRDVFACSGEELGRTHLVEHEIKTGDTRPIKIPPRRIPIHTEDQLKSEIVKLIRQKMIKPSKSPWSAPIVMVGKKDGTQRMCCDFRALNAATVKDAYPLPHVEDNLAQLGGSAWFSTLDLASGYWQVGVKPEDQEKTAFATPFGLFEWLVMPFGLCNGPSTFERLMEYVLRNERGKGVVLFLDDVIGHAKTFAEMIALLRIIFGRLREAGLKLKPQKCQLFQRKVEFLGHVVSEKGIETNPDITQKIRDWPTPTTKRDVRSFTGLTNYYRKFAKQYAEVAAPLNALTSKDCPFRWGEDEEQSFKTLKQLLLTAPILGYPCKEGRYVLDTDASACSMGAVLSQEQEGEERVLAYGSQTFSQAERNYCVTRRELLAVITFIEKYRHYLYGKRFLLRTDHAALRWLMNTKDPEGQLARWLNRLAPFDFEIQHRAGNRHSNADALSRIPCSGTCAQCGREHEDPSTTKRRPRSNSPQPNVGKTEVTPLPLTIRAVSTRQSVGRRGRGRKQRGAALVQQAIIGSGDGLKDADLLTAQHSDQDLQEVRGWLENDKFPSRDDISGESPDIKYLWAQRDRLCKNDNQLVCYMWLDPTTQISHKKVLLPRTHIPKLLTLMHDHPTSGHMGRDKTLARVRNSRFFWRNMSQDVASWCQRCDLCFRAKGPQKRCVAPMKSMPMGSPMERIAMDILGPFKPATGNNNTVILVVGDYFTKWATFIPLPDQQALTVAEALIEHVIAYLGVPAELLTDQGPDFMSGLMRELCNLLSIDKIRTSIYRPQTDGQVERLNRTVGRMLRQLVSEKEVNWDSYLPIMGMAYRSSIHSTTGYTPNFLMLGRECCPPYDVIEAAPGYETNELGYAKYATDLAARMRYCYALVRKHTQTAQERQKRYHDRKAQPPAFKRGDVVWAYLPLRQTGRSPKLQLAWTGPFVVTQQIGHLNVEVRSGPRARPKILHVDKCSKVKGDIEETWVDAVLRASPEIRNLEP